MKRGNGRRKWFSDCLAEVTTSKCNERRKTVIIRSYDFNRSRKELQRKHPLSKWQLQTWRREAMGKSSHDVTATDVCDETMRKSSYVVAIADVTSRETMWKCSYDATAADVRRDEKKIGCVLTTANATSTMRKSSYYTITAGVMIEIRWENPLTTWLLHTCVTSIVEEKILLRRDNWRRNERQWDNEKTLLQTWRQVTMRKLSHTATTETWRQVTMRKMVIGRDNWDVTSSDNEKNCHTPRQLRLDVKWRWPNCHTPRQLRLDVKWRWENCHTPRQLRRDVKWQWEKLS